MQKKKVLLTSVFGPYGRDDEYGSRKLNPMELYHNQVTREQGAFSLRMFHRSWGLMMIQANIDAPCVLLDFPTLARFVEEIRQNRYDIVGISSIIPNIGKVEKMCQLIRHYLPGAVIVVGGHIANVPDLKGKIGADHVVKGEGIRWFREFLGEDANRPIRHPLIKSGVGARNCGVTLRDRPGDVAATVIPSVGCPLGCNFCSTSAMFGGKGKCVHFYKTGDELFSVMVQLEWEMKVRSFFMMDENFLLHRSRAMRLLEFMEKYHKPWSLYAFTSANMLASYSIEELVRFGISWVWMGLEGENSQYQKLHGIDTFALVKKLQANGIHVLGSTIIGLEDHTPDNIDAVIDYALAHDTDFHQFMLYTPIRGTPLHAQLTAEGRMKNPGEYCEGDIHGQEILNYRHPHLTDEQTARFMKEAFRRNFEANGPSTARIIQTDLEGWMAHKNHPDPRVRSRVHWDCRNLPTRSSALVAASELYFADNPVVRSRMSELKKALNREFGWESRAWSALGGRCLLYAIRMEQKRLERGWAYEPPTFYEGNDFVDGTISRCKFVVP